MRTHDLGCAAQRPHLGHDLGASAGVRSQRALFLVRKGTGFLQDVLVLGPDLPQVVHERGVLDLVHLHFGKFETAREPHRVLRDAHRVVPGVGVDLFQHFGERPHEVLQVAAQLEVNLERVARDQERHREERDAPRPGAAVHDCHQRTQRYKGQVVEDALLEVALPDAPRTGPCRQPDHDRDAGRIDEEVRDPGRKQRNSIVREADHADRPTREFEHPGRREVAEHVDRDVVHDAHDGLAQDHAMRDRIHEQVGQRSPEWPQQDEHGQADHRARGDVAPARKGHGRQFTSEHQRESADQHPGRGNRGNERKAEGRDVAREQRGRGECDSRVVGAEQDRMPGCRRVTHNSIPRRELHGPCQTAGVERRETDNIQKGMWIPYRDLRCITSQRDQKAQRARR